MWKQNNFGLGRKPAQITFTFALDNLNVELKKV